MTDQDEIDSVEESTGDSPAGPAAKIIDGSHKAHEAESAFDPKAFLRTVTDRPGVYRMLDRHGEILYVGKAGNLKNRLSSYFQKTLDNAKTRAMVAQICDVHTAITASNAEALLLEHNLIKEHRPRYNVVLRDDKSYPYVFISTRDDYPRVSYQRGARRQKGKYIGPYPSAGAVKRSLSLAQKLFRVRQCEDSYFRNRSRPCLQYQIGRCTAPCVNHISKEDYASDVGMTVKLLEGKSNEVMADLATRMDEASAALDFERAAKLRDQIGSLKAVGDIGSSMDDQGNVDYVAAVTQGGQSCVQVFLVRNGVNLGNKAFYPATPAGSTDADVLNAFVSQFYLEHEMPREIVTAKAIEDAELLQEVFTARHGAKVSILHKVRGERARMQALTVTNAEIALAARLASRSGMAARLDAVRKLADLDDAPGRMECFDISHTMGEATVASCVVFNAEGPAKAEYRRFNIEDITPGDDYAAMRQALRRRYTRMLKEQRDLPDILFIDGGRGQIGVALEVVAELQISGMQVIGVSKGPDRRPGDETLILCNQQREQQLSSDSPALLLIQQIRDEAHRFAITGHRGRRAKKRQSSSLEDIAGLGPKRRKQLLTHFGGLQRLRKAGVEDIASVPGISTTLAVAVYDELHPGARTTDKSGV